MKGSGGSRPNSSKSVLFRDKTNEFNSMDSVHAGKINNSRPSSANSEDFKKQTVDYPDIYNPTPRSPDDQQSTNLGNEQRSLEEEYLLYSQKYQDIADRRNREIENAKNDDDYFLKAQETNYNASEEEEELNRRQEEIVNRLSKMQDSNSGYREEDEDSNYSYWKNAMKRNYDYQETKQDPEETKKGNKDEAWGILFNSSRPTSSRGRNE